MTTSPRDMGCGSSSDSVKSESKASLGTGVSSRASSNTRTPTLRHRGRIAPEVLANKDSPVVAAKHADNLSRDSGIDSAKANERQRTGKIEDGEVGVSTGNDAQNNNVKPVYQKGVAFEVDLKDGNKESLIKKHPPRRLQKLENAPRPKLTLEELEEQQKISSKRRLQALEQKAESSKRSSRRRNELLAAVNFSKEHQQQVTSKKLDEKIDSASKNRERHQAEVLRKQKIRETKARQAKERRLRASIEDEGYDVEKDETFNADDDVDSWLDGDNNVFTPQMKGSASTTASERIYDGRSSPAKRMHGGSGDQRRRLDVEWDSGDESETEAFSARKTASGNKDALKDDFFDS